MGHNLTKSPTVDEIISKLSYSWQKFITAFFFKALRVKMLKNNLLGKLSGFCDWLIYLHGG